MIQKVRDDLGLALRRLRNRPGYSAIAVLTLALGLGVNTAIFTLVHAAILQSLPVTRPEELVRLGDDDNCCVNSGLQDAYSLFSYRAYAHLREHTPELEALAAFQASAQPVGIRRAGEIVTESLPAEYVSSGYFSTFGIAPAAGRLLQAEDDRPGAPPVFVMSHAAWAARFGADPSVVGASFVVAGKPMTLVGVAARRFFGDTIRPDPASLWLPLGQEAYLRGATSLSSRPDQDWLYLIGRLAPGATRRSAEARATNEMQRWLSDQSFLSEEERRRLARVRVPVVAARGGVASLRYAYARPLGLLFAMSGLVLLIAAANLANLLLARTDRQQVAIEAALGASAASLARRALAEGLLLSLLGAGLGLLVAVGATRAIVALALAGARELPMQLSPSPLVLLFAFALAVVTAAAFSALPAWALARANPAGALHSAARSGDQRGFLPRRSLVVIQVALSLVLLASALLLTQSLRRLELQPLGFEPGGRLVARIRPAVRSDDRERLAAYYAEMRARLLRIPGVVDATYSLYSPMEGNNWSSSVSIAGRTRDPPVDSSSWNRIGPRYFETLGTRILSGRTIDERDTADAPLVSVVNRAFVRRFFPDQDPLGRRFGIGGGPEHAGDIEIVGVCEDVKYTAAQRPTRPMAFLPALQIPPFEDVTALNVHRRSTIMGAVELRLTPGARGTEPLLRRALAALDPDLAVVRVLDMPTQVSRNFRVNRLMARLTAAYAMLALAVAALGLYGVTAYAVARRTREIGVRMALGADRGRVLREIVKGALGQTVVGLLLGLPLALLATRALASQLYGIGPRDPLSFVAVTLVLLTSAALAALVPARRAAMVDPASALRTD
jgi:predicted permease